MTATTVKSSKVTALGVTVPPTLQDVKHQGGRVRVVADTIEAATTSLDETGDVILLCPINSSDTLHDLIIYNDDLDTGGTSGAVDIGLYNGPVAFTDTDASRTKKAAFAVIDVDAFASAVTTLTAANTAGTRVRYESNSNSGDLANMQKPVWEAAGLDSDPNKVFLIGVTVTTAMTTPAAGTLSLKAYVS